MCCCGIYDNHHTLLSSSRDVKNRERYGQGETVPLVVRLMNRKRSGVAKEQRIRGAFIKIKHKCLEYIPRVVEEAGSFSSVPK